MKRLKILGLALLVALTLSCESMKILSKKEPTRSFPEESAPTIKLSMSEDGIVRLSKVEVYPEYLDEYLNFAIEVGETSLQTEPGVLTMYGMADKENPCIITILETYASEEAYRSHVASVHFQKYKQGTLKMVKNLVLCDQTPLNPSSKLDNRIVNRAAQ